MKILALDPATQIGFASDEKSGSFSLGKTRPEKLLTLFEFIKETVLREKITHIVYEKPSGSHYNSLVSGASMEGVILLYCEMKGLYFMDYSPSAIKKFATGIGNCGKEEVIAAVKEWGYEPIDDNEADALALLRLAKTELK